MIPKIIHYCWFGSSPMPEEFRGYVEGWRKLLPGWRFMEWNDENIQTLYDPAQPKEKALVDWCYAEKKRLGFLTDYVRFTVLDRYGGFYLDTDVELLKPLDPFLGERHVFGYIFDALVGTATIGAEQGSAISRDLRTLILDNFAEKGVMTVSNNYVTQYFMDREKDFLLNGRNRRYGDFIILRRNFLEKYSSDRNAGYAWHHCGGSWRDKKEIGGLKAFCKKLMGKRFYYWLSHRYNMHLAFFKERYRHDKKIDRRDMFVVKNGEIIEKK